MGTAETFNQNRMNRCAGIAKQIINKTIKAQEVRYVARATQKVGGMTLDELRMQYFGVGPDRNNLVDVPFIDMLVIFSIVMQQLEDHSKSRGKKEFTSSMQVTTDWPDEAAARLLSQIVIQTPFDEGKVLRVEEVSQDEAAEEDDPQT